MDLQQDCRACTLKPVYLQKHRLHFRGKSLSSIAVVPKSSTMFPFIALWFHDLLTADRYPANLLPRGGAAAISEFSFYCTFMFSIIFKILAVRKQCVKDGMLSWAAAAPGA